MAAPLAEKTCTPCRGGYPPLSHDEAEYLHGQAPDWALLDDDTRIERTYRFKNFREAFAFVERAAALAETESHHPDISFGWGCARKRSGACTKTILSWRQSSTASPRKTRCRRKSSRKSPLKE
jgi:4a-hydroxytetrahydrobiopterin dehydratase